MTVDAFSENEIIYLRLCGLSCLLKLICHPYFYTRMKPEDFLIIITLLRVSVISLSRRGIRRNRVHCRIPRRPFVNGPTGN